MDKIPFSERDLKYIKLERQRREEWRRNPFKWLEERLGEDPNDFLWSMQGGYDAHVWDGDKNPIALAWAVLAKGYTQVAKGEQATYKKVGLESGTGCHAKGQGILMYDGTIKKVEEIQVGDKLMGDDSTPRNVLRLKRGSEQLYTINPHKGKPYTVNESHILSLKITGGKKLKHRSYPVFINVTVREYLTWSSKKKHLYKQYSVPVNFSVNKELPIEPYYMGLYIGDGTTGEAAITNIDSEVVDYIYEYADRLKASVSKRDSNGDRTPNYLIHFGHSINPLRRDIRKGLVNGLKDIPKDYLVNSRESRMQLLAGLIDSDGSRDGKGYEYTTVLPNIADQVSFLARSLGYMVTCSRVSNTHKGYYRLYISGDCSLIPVKVKRKKCAIRAIDKDPLMCGFTISKASYGDYYGFELDKNHLYLMDDFVVTHNTGKTYGLARIVAWYLDCFENSLVITTAPSEAQLDMGLWAEISNIYGKIKKIRPKAKKWKKRLAMEYVADPNWTEEEKAEAENNLWQARAFITGTSTNKESEDKARGFHREHMLIILEEATGIPLPILNAFENTCTGNTNFILAVGNPSNEFDTLHQFCLQEDTKHIIASSLDHPNIVTQTEKYKGAITQSSIDSRTKNFGEESAMWQAMVRGISPEQSVDSLIRKDWIKACIGTTKEPNDNSQPAVGTDVANSSTGDKAALAFGEYNTLQELQEFQCPNATHLAYNLLMDSDELSRRGYEDYNTSTVHKYGITADYIGVDAVGVGVATVNAFLDSNWTVQSLQGGQWADVIPTEDVWDGSKMVSKPMYKFRTLRSQMYWELREDIRLGNINISDSIPVELLNQLLKELCIPKYTADKGSIQVESKESIKKRMMGKSPNLADAIVYWNWTRKGYKVEDFGWGAIVS